MNTATATGCKRISNGFYEAVERGQRAAVTRRQAGRDARGEERVPTCAGCVTRPPFVVLTDLRGACVLAAPDTHFTSARSQRSAFSNEAKEGVENAVRQQGEYGWWTKRRGFSRNIPGADACDVCHRPAREGRAGRHRMCAASPSSPPRRGLKIAPIVPVGRLARLSTLAGASAEVAIAVYSADTHPGRPVRRRRQSRELP